MFILRADQVDHCVISCRMTNAKLRVPGLEYQRKLFAKGETYDQKDRQLAIDAARKALLSNKGQATLLVEEGESLTLWHHNKTAHRVNSLLTVDLKQIVSSMRNVGGVPIKKRQFRLRSYSQCFIGSEAVDWLVSYLKTSRKEAIRIGQCLVDENWIHHVLDEQPFQDTYFFYRFHWDEQ